MPAVSGLYCILNCVEDAKLFLKEHCEDYRYWVLVSTHDSVNDYLTIKNIECLSLASLITTGSIIENYKKIEVPLKQLLIWLDAQCSEKITSILQIRKVDFFRPIYRHLGKCEFFGIVNSAQALEVLFKRNTPKEILVYQSIETSCYGSGDLITDIVQLLSKKYRYIVKIKNNEVKANPSTVCYLIEKVLTAINDPAKAYQVIKDFIKKRSLSRLSKNKKTILIFDPLFDLKFIWGKLPGTYNTISWPAFGFAGHLSVEKKIDRKLFDRVSSIISDIEIDLFTIEDNDALNLWLHLVAKRTIIDFAENVEDYVSPLIILQRFHTKLPIDLGIWGNCPRSGSGAVIIEYLMRSGIPVIGMQHGGNHCTSKNEFSMFNLDFCSCSHFLTYGFDKKYLQRTYPARQVKCEIIPVGCVKKEKRSAFSNKNKSKVDIVFPVTFNPSITHGAFRVKSDLMTYYQLELIKTLDEFTNLRVVAKPMIGYSDKNYSVVQALKKVKHIKVISNVNLLRFLELYDTSAIVIEFPGTALFEIIGRDIEIFMMADLTLKLAPELLELVKKRVHYFENIKDMQMALIEWKNGNLPSLRDNELYLKHVFRENTEKLILKTIDKCVS